MAEPVQKLPHKGSVKSKLKEKKPSAKFTSGDYHLLASWLQEPGNLAKIEGDEGKTKIGGKVIVKSKAFEELASYINQNQKKGSTLREVTAKSMKSRWIFYFEKFRKTRDAAKGTGWGLTDEDVKLGLDTVEAKLEHLCPAYSKLAAIFKRSVKVKPHAEWDSRLDGEEEDVEEELHTWSVVPDSIPPEELFPGLNAENGYGIEELGDVEVVPNASLLRELGRKEGVNIMASRSAQAARPTQGAQATSEAINVDGGDGERQNRGARDGQVPPVNLRDSLSPPRDAAAQHIDLDSSDQNSENLETERSTPVRAGQQREKKRKSTSTAGKEKPYPSKKHIGETRHSINAAFAENLESINEHKGKLAELEVKRFEIQSVVEEKKATTERERFLWEKQQAVKDRKDRKEMAAAAEKQALRMAVISSSRSVEEITAIYELFK